MSKATISTVVENYSTGSYTLTTGQSTFHTRTLPSFIQKSLAAQDKQLHDQVKARQKMRIFENTIDITPIDLGRMKASEYESISNTSLSTLLHDFSTSGKNALQDINALKSTTTLRMSITSNLDDIFASMDTSVSFAEHSMIFEQIRTTKMPITLKTTLILTDVIILWESNSYIIERDSPLLQSVESDNARYEYLTNGKGKHRLRSEAETQTDYVLMKNRLMNTNPIYQRDGDAYVSDYILHDVYTSAKKKLSTNVDLTDEEKIQKITGPKNKEDHSYEEKLLKNENFKQAVMMTQRFLAGNIFRENQRRYRSMIKSDPLDLHAVYKYRLKKLWNYRSINLFSRSISSISLCPANADILAVGYGVYDWVSFKERVSGFVNIWSIKNPVNAEKSIRYNTPVTALCFSQGFPQLLAVGLYNGNIEVLDISESDLSLVARTEVPLSESIWEIRWFVPEKAEEILIVTQNGLVMKYSIGNNIYLQGCRQMHLGQGVGTIEGITPNNRLHGSDKLPADRHIQVSSLQLHPTKGDMYYVGTSEGNICTCSTYYPTQHIEIMKAHKENVTAIEFSPFSTNIFLTAGSDYFVRIWVVDILEPLIEIFCGFDVVRSAHWCPSNSTIIACMTRENFLVWNIRKSFFRPASIYTLSENRSLTNFVFTPCGRNVIVGNGFGEVTFYALEDMPFPPHFQKQELYSNIFKAIHNQPDLLRQVQSLGSLV